MTDPNITLRVDLMTTIPFHSDLQRDISLWLQANRNLTIEERIFKIKTMLYAANLDEATLLHYAASGFNAVDVIFQQTNKIMPLVVDVIKHGKEFGERLARRKKAKYAAKKKHERTNKAKDDIKTMWATGKYTSRDICAEQECADLNISFSTARKALRCTPEPLAAT